MSYVIGAVAQHMETLRQHTPDLQARYGVQRLGVFGSYLRDEQTTESDLDVLVVFHPEAHPTLLTVAGLEIELGDLLGITVDLVLYDGLRGRIGQRIRDEVVWI